MTTIYEYLGGARALHALAAAQYRRCLTDPVLAEVFGTQGRPGHVEPSEIEDAAPTAGLHATSTISACQDWTGTRLATPKGGRR